MDPNGVSKSFSVAEAEAADWRGRFARRCREQPRSFLRQVVAHSLSNTVIGILLLALGGITGVLPGVGLELGVAVLSVLSLLGAAAALGLRHVQR